MTRILIALLVLSFGVLAFAGTPMRVANIDTALVGSDGRIVVVNIEMWGNLPANSGTHIYRQIDQLNCTVGPPKGCYIIPIGPGATVILGATAPQDQYFDMSGNVINPRFYATGN